MLHVSPRRVKQGCMMVNTVLELADVEPVLHQLAVEKLSAIETAFARIFMRAQRAGELDTAVNPKELASLVMNINLGLRVQSRKNHTRKELKSIIDSSLSMLGLAA